MLYSFPDVRRPNNSMCNTDRHKQLTRLNGKSYLFRFHSTSKRYALNSCFLRITQCNEETFVFYTFFLSWSEHTKYLPNPALTSYIFRIHPLWLSFLQSTDSSFQYKKSATCTKHTRFACSNFYWYIYWYPRYAARLTSNRETDLRIFAGTYEPLFQPKKLNFILSRTLWIKPTPLLCLYHSTFDRRASKPAVGAMLGVPCPRWLSIRRYLR